MKPLELKACRIRNNISVHSASQALGVSEDTYRKRELGQRKMSLDEVQKLAKLYKMTYEEVNDIFFDNQLPAG